MSNRVRQATETAVSASISTPVTALVRTSAATRKPGRCIVDLDPHLHLGQRQRMAQRDQLGGPLGRHDAGQLGGCDDRPFGRRSRPHLLEGLGLAGQQPDAVAVRAVTSLSDTSTMRARPLSSTWVSPLIRKAPQPRHLPGERAGPVAAVELVFQDQVPAVAAGAGRARQAEDEGVVDLPGEGARLQRRQADRAEARLVEEDRESVHLAAEQRLDRFGRDVARREAGAAGGDDDVHAFVVDPCRDLGADRLDIVADDRLAGELVPGRGQPLGEQRTGLVRFLGPR